MRPGLVGLPLPGGNTGHFGEFFGLLSADKVRSFFATSGVVRRNFPGRLMCFGAVLRTVAGANFNIPDGLGHRVFCLNWEMLELGKPVVIGFVRNKGGGIAQLVERRVRNAKARGSNPLTSTITTKKGLPEGSPFL